MTTTGTGRLWKEARSDETVVPCPACAGLEFEVLLTPEDVRCQREWLLEFYSRRTRDLKDHADFTQCENTFILKCLKCGTVLRNPRPDPPELERRYRDDHYGRRTLEQLLTGSREFFKSKARAYRSTLKPGSRVLEVGSYVGAFLMAAEEMGWDATGVDIGEETSAFCLGKKLRVLTKPLCQIAPDWDAIFIWNTFDQLADPDEVLTHAKRVLSPGGRLVLRVPNGSFLTSALELMRQRPARAERVLTAMAYNNFVTFPYLTGYTTSSLSLLLRQKGFRVLGVQGDTIMPLASESTPEWAVREEQLYKRAVMRACNAGEALTCPWFDITAQVWNEVSGT